MWHLSSGYHNSSCSIWRDSCLDAFMNSIYAFVIVNGFLLLSVTVIEVIDNMLIRCILFPSFLMGMQCETSQMIIGIIAVSFYLVIGTVVYLILTNRKDMVL